MTMTDHSPPPSPIVTTKMDDSDEHGSRCGVVSPSTAFVRLPHPTLPASAINKSLYFHFPTPPSSPPSALPRIPSPRSPVLRTKHTRTASRTSTAGHSRRRSSQLSTSSIHISQLVSIEQQAQSFGPPPFPAPTTPLPPVPGAPKIAYTTPAQERNRRNRYSSYQLYDTLLEFERMQLRGDQGGMKRHSAPPMRPRPLAQSAPVSRNASSEMHELIATAKAMRKANSDQVGVREDMRLRRELRRER